MKLYFLCSEFKSNSSSSRKQISVLKGVAASPNAVTETVDSVCTNSSIQNCVKLDILSNNRLVTQQMGQPDAYISLNHPITQ